MTAFAKMQTQVPTDWTPRLTSAVANALREFTPQLKGEPVALLALDCLPWQGAIGLSVVTAAELAIDEALADPAEMAAWRHYDFADTLLGWQCISELGAEMKVTYEAGDRAAVGVAFLQACATAITAPAVNAALAEWPRSPEFRVSVTHPDSGREFVLAEFPFT